MMIIFESASCQRMPRCVPAMTYVGSQSLLSRDQLNGRSLDSRLIVSSGGQPMMRAPATFARGSHLLRLAQNKVLTQRASRLQPEVQEGTKTRSPASGESLLRHGRYLRLSPATV